MPFTSITKPAIGKPTRKQAHIDAIIDDLEYLNSELNSAKTTGGVVNGGFEYDTDSDDTPDGWSLTLLNGGSATLTSTDQYDGASCWTATAPGGSGNGGAELETTDYIPCIPGEWYWFNWAMFCSAAAMDCRVLVTFYDDTPSSVEAVTIYKSIINPTAWGHYDSCAKSPSTARYMKIKLVGGAEDSAAGTVYFDAIKIGAKERRYQFGATFPNGAFESGIDLTEVSTSSSVQVGADGWFTRYTSSGLSLGFSQVYNYASVQGRFSPFIHARVRTGGTSTGLNQIIGFMNKSWESLTPTGLFIYCGTESAYYKIGMDNATGTYYDYVDSTVSVEATLTAHDVFLWYDPQADKGIAKIDNAAPFEISGAKLPDDTDTMGPYIAQHNTAASARSIDVQHFTVGMEL